MTIDDVKAESNEPKFIKRVNDDGEPIECECCGYEAATSLFSGHAEGLRGLETKKTYLCEVCSSTHLSSSVNYPSWCPDPQLWQSIGWLANRILDEIRSTR